jgi:hypothetical protein
MMTLCWIVTHITNQVAMYVTFWEGNIAQALALVLLQRRFLQNPESGLFLKAGCNWYNDLHLLMDQS